MKVRDKKKKVLYISTKATTFVKRDIELLSQAYRVHHFIFYSVSKSATPILFIKQLFFLIRHIFSSKAILSMFAGYHSLMPALLCRICQKPFVIILGGTDSVVIPTLNYGILGKTLIGRFAKITYRLTKYFAPVHISLVQSENHYADIVPVLQGVKNHVTRINAVFQEIPNGFDAEKFKIFDHMERGNNSFITVAHDIHNPKILSLKGVDLIFKVAPLFPNYTFTVVGCDEILVCPKNVHLLPSSDQKKLIQLFNAHEFYLQLSLSEGFPNALSEAMLCGCIPIVSDVAAMPEIVAGVGFILKKRDEAMLADLLGKVKNIEKTDLSKKSRERIILKYPLERRKNELVNFIDKISEG